MPLPRTILVPTDFSEFGDAALAYAAELASRIGATLHLVHVIALPATGMPEMGVVYSSMNFESVVEAANAKLNELAARYRDRVSIGGVQVEVGDAREGIVDAAESLRADLIVLGTHGRRGVRRWLIGSVAEAVVRSAPCPVLTVRPDQGS